MGHRSSGDLLTQRSEGPSNPLSVRRERRILILCLAKLEQRAVARDDLAGGAKRRDELGQVDRAAVRGRRKIFEERAGAVHEARAVEAVADAVHV